MPHSDAKRIYIRRVNSNGEDVYPTVCATQYKLPQRQGDNSGAYVLDYIRKPLVNGSTPLTPKSKV